MSSDSGASETERDEKEDADDERDGDETNSEEDVRKKNVNIISSVINLSFEHWTTNRQLIAFMQARPKKRAKHEIQADIIKLLAPKFCEAMISPNKLDWSASKSKRKVGRSTLFSDVQDLQTLLMAISRANPDRAGQALSQMLSTKGNKRLREIVKESFASSHTANQSKVIIGGVRDCISYHTQCKGHRSQARIMCRREDFRTRALYGSTYRCFQMEGCQGRVERLRRRGRWSPVQNFRRRSAECGCRLREEGGCRDIFDEPSL